MKNGTTIRAIIAVVVVVFLTWLLISFEVFELLHEFTRSHESWDLDEIILVVTGILIVTPVWAAIELKLSRDQIKKSAEAQVAMEQELSEARRGQAMGSLAGGMAHSGNNMLQAILTLARTAQNRLPATSPAQEIIEKIIRSASQTSDIFTSVLKLSRSERMSGDAIDFGDYLLRNMGVLGTTVALNVSVDFEDIATGFTVPLSEAECTDIMLVLLSNASDSFGGKVGQISIRMDHKTDNNGTMILSVKDSGSGIPDEIQPRIFDAFYTTKPAGEGTGIGLSVVKRIVERAGGTISFTSMVNNGTTFVIKLPVAGEQ